MSERAVQIIHLSKSYGRLRAVDDLSFEVLPGEILALVGPSGCGKTTLLRLIAGFERPDDGEVHIQGRPAAGRGFFVPPERRGVGMVFQDYALFPHLTVAQNVAFGLQDDLVSEREIGVSHLLALAGLEGYEQRYPHELSGGERQRVALARALGPRPVLILLDEPFSSLDADRRSQMREEVRAILKEAGIAAIFVTHDQEEALFFGDRLGVIQNGRLEQADTPEGIFHRPATRFVAEFMGETDFLPGIVSPEGILTEIGLLAQRHGLQHGTPVELALRADDIGFEPQPGGAARVVARYFKGALNLYRLQLPSGRLLHAFKPHYYCLPPGTAVRVFPDAGHSLACFYQGLAVPPLDVE